MYIEAKRETVKSQAIGEWIALNGTCVHASTSKVTLVLKVSLKKMLWHCGDRDWLDVSVHPWKQPTYLTYDGNFESPLSNENSMEECWEGAGCIVLLYWVLVYWVPIDWVGFVWSPRSKNASSFHRLPVPCCRNSKRNWRVWAGKPWTVSCRFPGECHNS